MLAFKCIRAFCPFFKMLIFQHIQAFHPLFGFPTHLGISLIFSNIEFPTVHSNFSPISSCWFFNAFEKFAPHPNPPRFCLPTHLAYLARHKKPNYSTFDKGATTWTTNFRSNSKVRPLFHIPSRT